jgi:hypothetical protein
MASPKFGCPVHDVMHYNSIALCGYLQDKQLTKASFLAELRGTSQQQKQLGAGRATAAQGSAPSEQAAASDAPAWKALQEDFSSLQSGLRMKVSCKHADKMLLFLHTCMYSHDRWRVRAPCDHLIRFCV